MQHPLYRAASPIKEGNVWRSLQGYAVSVTFVKDMAVLSGLYLNVHDLDGVPVACGNLTGMMPM